MDAEATLVGVEEPVRHPEPVPLRAHHEHPLRDPQFAGDDVYDGGVAAVRIDDHELADPRARHADADVDPVGDEPVRRTRERAGLLQMLVRLPDLLDREHEDLEVGGDPLAQQAEHPGCDGAVGRNGKMRTVLLGRRDGKNGHDRFRVEIVEIPCRQLVPEKHDAPSHRSRLAQTLRPLSGARKASK